MITSTLSHLERRRRLAEQLIVEYAGAVPPGTVLSAVVRADHVLGRGATDAPRRLSACEAIARRRLAEYAARGASRLVAAP